MTRSWLFNLDADFELEDPAGYSRSKGMRRRIAALLPRLEGLLRSGEHPAELDAELEGVSPDLGRRCGEIALWCPTPSALRRARELGFSSPKAPRVEVLRRVNGRSFLASFGPSLEGARVLQGFASSGARSVSARSRSAVDGSALDDRVLTQASEAALREALARWPDGGVVLKREHGFAGQGLRRVGGGVPGSERPRRGERAQETACERTDERRGKRTGARRAERTAERRGDRRWLREALALGPVFLEPWVPRGLDLVRHGWVEEDGGVRVGPAGVQDCDQRGMWRATRLPNPGEVWASEQAASLKWAHRVGRELAEAGYFGPFGIDGFRWRDLAGDWQFHPCCDLNARYTMGWGLSRDVLERP